MIKAQTSQLFIIILWNISEIYSLLDLLEFVIVLPALVLVELQLTTQFTPLLIAIYRMHSHYLLLYFT